MIRLDIILSVQPKSKERHICCHILHMHSPGKTEQPILVTCSWAKKLVKSTSSAGKRRERECAWKLCRIRLAPNRPRLDLVTDRAGEWRGEEDKVYHRAQAAPLPSDLCRQREERAPPRASLRPPTPQLLAGTPAAQPVDPHQSKPVDAADKERGCHRCLIRVARSSPAAPLLDMR